MAVAELGVAGIRRGVCAAGGVVLLGDMLGKVRRDHLLNLLGLVGLGFLCLFCFLAQEVSRALRSVLMVVALHQGGVRVGRSTHCCVVGELGTPGRAAPFRKVCGRLRTIAFGCDSGDSMGGI